MCDLVFEPFRSTNPPTPIFPAVKNHPRQIRTRRKLFLSPDSQAGERSREWSIMIRTDREQGSQKHSPYVNFVSNYVFVAVRC